MFNLTGSRCNVSSADLPTDLNTPSITIASLNGTRVVPRTVTSVSNQTETWSIKVSQPEGVSVAVAPQNFTIAPSATQKLVVALTPTVDSPVFTFGEIFLTGSLGHTAHIPISIIQSQVAAR